MGDLKKEFRSRACQQRQLLKSDFLQKASVLICESLSGLPSVRSAQNILAFWPIEGKNEIDLRSFILHENGLGKSIFLPSIKEPTEGLLTIRQFCSTTNLTPGPFHTLEPLGSDVPAEIIDIVIVPGLLFDEQGYRIGYGGGFYDRLLSSVRYDSLSIGVCIDEFIQRDLARETHDIAVKLVLSEVRTIDPAKTVTAK